MKYLKTAFVLTLGFGSFAQAALIDVTNNVWAPGEIIEAPGSVTNMDIGSDQTQYGFDEAQGVYLENALTTTSGIVKAGKTVNSHMIFLNHESSADSTKIWADNTWTFDGKILGIMTDWMGADEVASTGFLGATDTIYPTEAFAYRGLERNDHVWLVGTDSLRVVMKVAQPGDWIRVITSVPEPGSMGMLAIGGLALVFARRRATTTASA